MLCYAFLVSYIISTDETCVKYRKRTIAVPLVPCTFLQGFTTKSKSDGALCTVMPFCCWLASHIVNNLRYIHRIIPGKFREFQHGYRYKTCRYLARQLEMRSVYTEGRRGY